MISAYLYVFLVAAVLPFFWWQQVQEGRNYVLILLTGAFLSCWTLFGKLPFQYDMTTMVVAAFSLWMAGTMFWTESRNNWWELLTWLSCMTVFLVSRTIPAAHLLPMLFATGVIFASVTLYDIIRAKKEHPYFILGNPNHFGAFMLVYIFLGLWLIVNASLWYIAPTLVIAAALGLGKSRGALLAFFIAAYVVLCMSVSWVIYAMPVALLGCLLAMKVRIGRKVLESTNRRLILYIGTLLLIVKKPFAGYGLRMFRQEYPNIIPLLSQRRIVKKILAKTGTIDGTTTESVKSHRVHNDHLETIMETGVIGYGLFLLIFATLNWTANPILAGVVVAFAINGLFFFPLREVHTAVPFWAATGAMATSPSPPAGMAYFIGIVAVLIIGRVMFMVAKKLRGLYAFYNASRLCTPEDITKKTPDHIKMDGQRRCLIDLAINDDPYNNDYLTSGYFYNLNAKNPDPPKAFQYASRCMENYDGEKVKWGMFDQYARALLAMGGFGVAKMALGYALYLCPGFRQAESMFEQIETAEKQGQGVQVKAEGE